MIILPVIRRSLPCFMFHFRYENSNRNMFTSAACQNFVLKNVIHSKRVTHPSILINRCMAGHAKWQNVKDIKSAKDREKSMLCNKYVRLVSAAVKENGADPKLNYKLASILEEAKRNNVPAATLESSLKRAQNKKLKAGTVEILGPGGCFIIVDFETDNICNVRHTLKVICKKYSANLLPGEIGRWRSAYEQKGIIKVTNQLNGENFDQEKALDAAIEAGAEDVQKKEDENDKTFYEFVCAVDDLHVVKKELEKNYAVEEAYLGYLPISTILLTDNDMILANKFLDEVGNIPDVSRMFENIE